MKTAIKILFAFYILILSSCSKQLPIALPDQSSKNIIQAIRDIVGGDGRIITLDTAIFMDKNFNPNLNTISSKSYIKVLSIKEFKNLFQEFHQRTISFTSNGSSTSKHKFTYQSLLSNNQIKSNDYDNIDIGYPELEDSSRPGVAGYHHAQFFPSSNLNKDMGGFYTLHLYFNTDLNGRVIGNPSIFYSGVGFYSWQQMNNSTISFNSQTLISNFTITGIGVYGLQVGGVTLGWSDLVNFRIKIDMNESVDKQVSLEQNQ